MNLWQVAFVSSYVNDVIFEHKLSKYLFENANVPLWYERNYLLCRLTTYFNIIMDR